MSQENAEIVRQMHDAFNRGDYAAALSVLAPDVEWHAPSGVSIGEEVFRGHDAVRRGFALWLDAWEVDRVEPTEILDHGDHVVVTGTQRGRGRWRVHKLALAEFGSPPLMSESATRILAGGSRQLKRRS
jgi:ketosteroid isomerase-like protein